MSGWVKLHQQLVHNDIWLRDQTAWHIFEYLLLEAYNGKPQGVVVTSRHKIANTLGGNNNTIYKAVKRLEKSKMITTLVTNKYTTIRICNWHKYQTDSNNLSNNKATTKQQQSNTLIRIENKNKELLPNDSVEQVRLLYELFIEKFGKNPSTYKLTDKRKVKLRQRIKDGGYPLVERAINNTASSGWHRGDNDRGWEADLDFIIRSYEQVEKLGSFNEAHQTKSLKEYA